MTAAPSLWSLQPHTGAKHEILKRYLEAWIPIFGYSGTSPRLFYIDGFAGPGKYSDGEDGSPIVALRSALSHATKLKSRIDFHFVEADSARASHLDDYIGNIRLPSQVSVKVHAGVPFTAAYERIKVEYSLSTRSAPPTFAFIDPFGWTGAPFSIVKELMSAPKSEVLVNLMYESINRHLSHPDQLKNFTALFGTDEWKSTLNLSDKTQRGSALHRLYQTQLERSAGIKFVRSFEMRDDGNRIEYFMFFGSNEELGLRKMKEAMWRVDQSGQFSFSDATDQDQLVLFDKADFRPLHDAIVNAFAGATVSIEEIESFVIRCTAFRETHFKAVLKDLEITAPPSIEVIVPENGSLAKLRRRGTFPAGRGLLIRFCS